jgi:hypothetical protein
MPFIGNAPARVPLTSADITDSIITSAKIVDGTIVNADINASAAIASTKLSGLSSDFVLLASTEASSSASVSFDGYFSSTYKNYKIIGSYVIPATDAAEVRIRFRRTNSDVTASNYSTVIQHAQGDSTPSSGTYGSVIWNASSFKLGNASLDNTTSSGGANFELVIYNPLDVNSYKWFTSNSAYINSTAVEMYTHNQSGWLSNATTALSGISFFMSSGNIASGNFKLYGIK